MKPFKTKTIEPKDYPGYWETVPSCFGLFLDFCQTKIRRRYAIIAILLLVSLVQFGAEPFKAVAVSLAAYILMVLPLGTRHVERLTLIAFVIAAISWLDMIHIEQFTQLCG